MASQLDPSTAAKKGSEGGRTAPVDYVDALNYLQAALKEIVQVAKLLNL
jgi:hypothetical protein